MAHVGRLHFCISGIERHYKNSFRSVATIVPVTTIARPVSSVGTSFRLTKSLWLESICTRADAFVRFTANDFSVYAQRADTRSVREYGVTSLPTFCIFFFFFFFFWRSMFAALVALLFAYRFLSLFLTLNSFTATGDKNRVLQTA